THVQASNVVVAVGLTNAQYIPKIFTPFIKTFVSHTADYTRYDHFNNKRVLVLGGGQSAWEAAALLYQAGANVDLAYRRPERLVPDEDTNVKQQKLATEFFHMTAKEQ